MSKSQDKRIATQQPEKRPEARDYDSLGELEDAESAYMDQQDRDIEALQKLIDAQVIKLKGRREAWEEAEAENSRHREALEGIEEVQREVERIRTLTSTERIIKNIIVAALAE